jgi:hypothetical protein
MKHFFDQADSTWTIIMNDTEGNNDYTQEHFKYLRDVIDHDLEEYKGYDDTRNNFVQNSSRQ